MLEDRILLWKFKRGSSQALEKLYEKYKTYLITVATALLNDTNAAEDILHDFFIMFVLSADKVKINGNLKAYFATCVANLARNKLKRNQLEPVPLEDNYQITSLAFQPENLITKIEEATVLNKALAKLPYEQREAIILHLHGNLKFTQIAELRGTSINTIQSRYRYGLNKLRSLLNSEVIE